MNFDAFTYRYDTKDLAINAIKELTQLAEDNGFISLATFAKQAGVEPSKDDFLYGWKDLDAAIACPIGDTFYIRMPRPSLIKYFFHGGNNNE